ncbi:hypothetical protein WJ974_19485 [Achromobacter xylosoxidans]
MTLLIALVILSFSTIHLLEYLSYYARIAGRLAGKPVTGYAVQNATTTITRFFYLALMPLLGFLIDKQIPVVTYQMMGLGALAGATVLSLLAFFIRFHWITLLANFIQRRSGKPKLRTADVRKQLETPSRFLARASSYWRRQCSSAMRLACSCRTTLPWCFTTTAAPFRNSPAS